jgi:hypothetical protein
VAFTKVLDTRQFEKRMKLYDKKARIEARKAMSENRDDLELRAKNMAPKDEGNLEGSIQGNPTVKFSLRDGSLTAEVHAGVSGASAKSNAWKYALRVHESMWPAIPSGDRQMQPGPITQAKGDAAGPAGGKYLTRPLVFYMKKYTENIARRMRRIR